MINLLGGLLALGDAAPGIGDADKDRHESDVEEARRVGDVESPAFNRDGEVLELLADLLNGLLPPTTNLFDFVVTDLLGDLVVPVTRPSQSSDDHTDKRQMKHNARGREDGGHCFATFARDRCGEHEERCSEEGATHGEGEIHPLITRRAESIRSHGRVSARELRKENGGVFLIRVGWPVPFAPSAGQFVGAVERIHTENKRDEEAQPSDEINNHGHPDRKANAAAAAPACA